MGGHLPRGHRRGGGDRLGGTAVGKIVARESIKLLEAVGPSGRLVSYEVREDFAASGARTVERFLGKCQNHEIRVRDIYGGIEERDVDRIVLDLPEPWHVVPHAAQALVPGGIVLSYLPWA